MTALASVIIGFERDLSELPLQPQMIKQSPRILQMRIDPLQRNHAAHRRPRPLPAEIGNQGNVLIERQRPRKAARLRHVCGLRRLQARRRSQPHTHGNVVEKIVVTHPNTGADRQLSAAAR